MKMRVICAYNVNIDAVHNISDLSLSRLIECCGSRPQHLAPQSISSLDDLLSSLIFCIKNGCGAELLVNSPDVAGLIERTFSWDVRLGGNAGNMAQALAELGAEPILNVPSLTQRLASMLNPSVRIPVRDAEILHLRSPFEAVRDEEDSLHFVLQFKRGQAITAREETIASKRENRLIATFDSLNQRLYVDPDFHAYCADHIRELDGALISGFHLLPFLGHKRATEERLSQISSWKTVNPDLFVHVEMGSFQRPEIMKHLMQRLSAGKMVDSIGMNEDELALICSFEPVWMEILEAARDLQERCGISRVCVHTRDYIISAVKGSIPPQQEVDALECGASAAAALALKGRVGARPHAGRRSLVGEAAVNELCKWPKAARQGRSAYVSSGQAFLCLTPSVEILKPLVTVGLGDAMTAASYYRELKALKGLALGPPKPLPEG